MFVGFALVALFPLLVLANERAPVPDPIEELVLGLKDFVKSSRLLGEVGLLE